MKAPAASEQSGNGSLDGCMLGDRAPEVSQANVDRGNASRRPAHVIFIAGSAGSLDALQRLFCELSPTIDAAVLITIHLPPDHRTLLPTILARVTSMPLSLARADEPLERGHVYVAPPGYHHVIVREGRVQLLQQPVNARRGASADPLFVSAAQSFGAAAIGVVLSGANTNGAAGVRSIRAAGGRALAQDPNDAAFPTMPRAAVDAGVDYCGSADDIGRYLSALCVPRD